MSANWMRAGVVVVSLMLTANRAGSQPSQPSERNGVGRAVYLAACASCHGEAGSGYGPASWILKERPPDLTRLSDRKTPFPAENIRNVIRGRIRLEPSHLPDEMPIWRSGLDTTVPGTNVTQLEALLQYLQEIQLVAFGSDRRITPRELAASGRVLFQTHCTACHGVDGRGNAVAGYTVGPSTDLTLIASRNAGAFELRRVYESIARCGDAPATSDMPSWQRNFMRAGWGRYVTMKNLEALATYVESIQR